MIKRQREAAKAPKPPVSKCPRQMSRDDCDHWSDGPKPRHITSIKPYPNGTKLVVYSDGTYEINGYKLPPGHPDPDQLAKAVDSVRPRGNHKDTDREWAIESVLLGCGELYSRAVQKAGSGRPQGYCSSNFVRAVAKDFDDETISLDERPWDENAVSGVDAAGNALGVCPAPYNCTGAMRRVASYAAQLLYAMSISPAEFCGLPGEIHALTAISGPIIGMAPGLVGPVGEGIALGAAAYRYLNDEHVSVIVPVIR